MRIKNGRLLPKVLSTIGNAALAFSFGDGHTSTGVYRMFREFDRLQEISDKKLRQTVQYAIGKKYIVIVYDKGGAHIMLTKEGKRLLGRQAIEDLKLTSQKRWDKKWRIVLFDIPETHKNGRDGFAADLKRIGFEKIQKSGFAYPYPCFEELEVLADFHQVRKYISCIVADALMSDKELRKHFKLPST